VAPEGVSERNDLKSAGAMSVAVMMSRVLGLVREQVFAAWFGATHANDAFQIAFRIPNLLRDLFAEGAMSAALVPTFLKARSTGGTARGWQVATRVFAVLFLVVSVLSVLGFYFADSLVTLYAASYHEVPGKFELTVKLTREMMPFFPLVAIAAAVMALLNACGKFFIPAVSSAAFNAVSIFVGIALVPVADRIGLERIEAMALGVVLGGLCQLLVQLPLLFKQGFRFAWVSPLTISLRQDPEVRRMMMLMIPGTLGLAATQINILVNSVLATGEGQGAVSWLNYSFRLMQFPIGVFGVALASATLPTVSQHWINHDFGRTRRSIEVALERVFAINFAAAAGLAGFGVPIVSLLYERGAFTSSDTLATAQALAFYAVGLGFYSAVKVLVPACYAMGITRVAVFSSVFSVIANLGINLALIRPLGFAGLALGTSLTAILNAVLLALFADRRLRSRGSADFPLRWLGRILLHGIGALILYFILKMALNWLPMASGLTLLPYVLGAMVAGVVFILFWAKCFKLETTLEIVSLFHRKLR
jgi:putative peptidoglycan lipid II flippase